VHSRLERASWRAQLCRNYLTDCRTIWRVGGRARACAIGMRGHLTLIAQARRRGLLERCDVTVRAAYGAAV